MVIIKRRKEKGCRLERLINEKFNMVVGIINENRNFKNIFVKRWNKGIIKYRLLVLFFRR